MYDGIVIGEGVLLDARPAGILSRFLGAVIDMIALGIVLILLIWAGAGWAADMFTAGESGTDIVSIAVLVSTVVLLVGIPTTVETLTRGWSLGKFAAGIRVVRDDGGPIRFRHAFTRALVGVFELNPLIFAFPAALTSLINGRGKRLGDLAAGTYVVRVRGARQAQVPIVMPPELAGWAGATDMRRLPDGLALAARQFLSRAYRLSPPSRIRLADDLAGRIEPYVAPGPPVGTPPEVFLHAVLAERRSREEEAGRSRQARAVEQAGLLHRLPYAVPDLPD